MNDLHIYYHSPLICYTVCIYDLEVWEQTEGIQLEFCNGRDFFFLVVLTKGRWCSDVTKTLRLPSPESWPILIRGALSQY